MMLANTSVAMDEPRAIRLASATIASGRSADQWMRRTHFLCCSNVPQATTAKMKPAALSAPVRISPLGIAIPSLATVPRANAISG